MDKILKILSNYLNPSVVVLGQNLVEQWDPLNVNKESTSVFSR